MKIAKNVNNLGTELVYDIFSKTKKLENKGKKIIEDKIGKFIIILILSKLLMLIIQLTSRMHNHK